MRASKWIGASCRYSQDKRAFPIFTIIYLKCDAICSFIDACLDSVVFLWDARFKVNLDAEQQMFDLRTFRRRPPGTLMLELDVSIGGGVFLDKAFERHARLSRHVFCKP
ncbi:hypothetical protein ACLOJK_030809 [Asimina triloba]